MAARSYRAQYAQYTRYFRQLAQVYAEKPEVRASLELLLTLLAISFFAVFALRPTLNTIADLFAEIRAQEEIAEKLDQKIEDLEAAQATFSQEQLRLTLLNQALPKKSEPEEFLRQTEGLAAAHGVSLRSFSVGEVQLFGASIADKNKEKQKKGSAGTQEVQVSLVVGGNYENLMAFLKDLESLRRILQISSISFSSSQVAGPLILSISGNAPYLR